MSSADRRRLPCPRPGSPPSVIAASVAVGSTGRKWAGARTFPLAIPASPHRSVRVPAACPFGRPPAYPVFARDHGAEGMAGATLPPETGAPS